MNTEVVSSARLDGSSLAAWQGFFGSHIAITRALDAELVARHGLTLSDYEVLFHLARAPQRRLRMSDLAGRVLLTRSGITRLVAGLEEAGLVARVACPEDGRVSYASLTGAGAAKLRAAALTHLSGVRAHFLAHFSDEEIGELAELLGRLPGAAQCDVSGDEVA